MSTNDYINRLIRPEIRALKAYHVPPAHDLIKLDAMENPYGIPDELRAGWDEALRKVEVNRYPDADAQVLKARLREALGVPPGMALLLGNGSDELIQMILLALARADSFVVAPTPTFAMYEIVAAATGVRFVGVPLTPDFELDLEAMLAAVARHRPAVIFLSYPNNPTGNLFDSQAVARVIEIAPGLVILDEAYHAFADATFMDRLGRYDNLLVMRTLSKQGLAGLRLGVLVGAPAWLNEFDKLRLPYNVNCLTQAAAAFVLAHPAPFARQTQQIRADRETLYGALTALPGVYAWPSRANFILFRLTGRPATDVHAALQARGVLIKNLDHADGPLAGCLRVTVGTPAENQAFLTALAEAL